MRWIGSRHLAAGINARGFFDLFGKPAVTAAISGLASGIGGFLAGGIFLTSGETKTATRFNTSFLALAQNTSDTLVSIFDANGVLAASFVPGRFIISDLSGHIADSIDGVTWTLGNLHAAPGDFIELGYTIVYDDLNAKIIAAGTPNATFVYTAPNTSPLNFTAVNLGADNFFGGIAYKGAGTGITLGIVGPGGPNQNRVYKSTNGGTTWALVGNTAFVNANFLVRLHTHWMVVGSDGFALQYSLSTDDGVTWTAPTAFPGVNNQSPTAGVSDDGAGNVVVLGAAPPPDNYWVSANDGVTFTSPNLFSSNNGSSPGKILHSGTHWLAAWFDATDSFNFLATSSDGKTWTRANSVIDLP